ncbi:MAG TPA: S8 family serine peptidase [Candidatus Cloacimonadota bacterium]|nr:S8 family serine peptidase [Candidatus Cloacimonadota bacterium]HPT72556.1 S8 family serine peptidase [Candidatus Cloacimonadota bacterium]
MRKLSLIFIMLVVVFALQAVRFNQDYFYPNTIVVCFSKQAVNNIQGKIPYSLKDGSIHTGLKSFDKLAAQYGITGMEQMTPDVKDLYWNDNGLYIQLFYRLTIKSNDNIEQAIDSLTKDPYILFSDYESILKERMIPNDPLFSTQWHLPIIWCPQAWDYETGSGDVVIGIVDSGVKYNHPDLQANIWVNQAELNAGMTINWSNGTVSGGNGVDDDGNGKVDDVIGWDFNENNAHATDNNPYQSYATNDHGTHVSGCANAVGDNSLGVSGSAMHAKIMISKHAPSNAASENIYNGWSGITYCADSGAEIINCSWGGYSSSVTQANTYVNYAMNHGALVCVAAGNGDSANQGIEHGVVYTGSDTSAPYYGLVYHDSPADCDNALCVAASDQNDVKASWSDYGSPIDVVAPGVSIQSTIITGNGYQFYDGTSMATPITAGVVALVKSKHPELTPLQLKQRMIDTCDNIDATNPNYVGKLGGGRINAFAATMYDLIPFITVEDKIMSEVDGNGDGIPNPGETISLKVLLNNRIDPYSGLAWATANNLHATLSSSYPGVTVIDADATFGNVSGGSSIMNNAHPFRFSTVPGITTEPIPFNLTVTANEGTENPYTVVLPVNIQLSLVHAGWPLNLNGASQSSALIIDLNNDGVKEIVFGDQTGNIHAVNRMNSSELPNFPINCGSAVNQAVAVDDINNDGQKEIVACLQNNNIVCYNLSGTQVFTPVAGGSALRSNPVIADLDNDGQKEIITSTQAGKIIVLRPDGSNYPNFPITLDAGMLSSIAVGNLNADSNLEIVATTLNSKVQVISLETQQNIAGFPFTMNASSQSGAIVADIDNDGQLEIIVASSTNANLYALNGDGTTVFAPQPLGQSLKTSPIVGDINNDGQKEIILPTYNGNLYVMNHQGATLSGFPVSLGANTECAPILAALDNANEQCIIIGDASGKLHAIEPNATEANNFPITLNGNLKVSAAIGFLDDANELDLAIPNDVGFYLLDMRRTLNNIAWPCFRATPQRAANSSTITPNSDITLPTVTTALISNYPNPFNPETTIAYSIKNPTHVNIKIYNIKGQLVKTLVSEAKASGTYQVKWNGMDDHGRGVASGVYYYRMTAGNYQSVHKMVLLK